MTEVAMMQAAVFQLRSAMETIEDEFVRTQFRLAVGVLGNAIDAAADGVNAAIVNEIEFALNDVVAAVNELPPAESTTIEGAVSMLQGDVASLKNATALPADVLNGIRSLQSKLKTRRSAIERQTYVENATEPLPHAPEELREEALPIRQRLTSAGFMTPALDTLISDPASLRFHSINAIIDELDVVSGT